MFLVKGPNEIKDLFNNYFTSLTEAALSTLGCFIIIFSIFLKNELKSAVDVHFVKEF